MTGLPRRGAPGLDNLEGLVLTRDLPGPGARAWLGWKLHVDPVDAGGGFEPIARFLGQALCACFTLTFLQEGVVPAGEGWLPIDRGAIRSLESRNPLSASFRRLRRLPPASLISTGDGELASRLFLPSLWNHGAQLVLFTAPASPPLQLGRRELSLLHRSALSLADLSSVPGACGLMTPGHDGNWAVFAFLRREPLELLLQRLAAICAQAGRSWEEVPESEFLLRLHPG